MEKKIIQRSIEINASVDKVWKVFTDPLLTRKMGGEYVTDWRVGSSFGWKGTDGKMYTSGTILEIENEKLIKHNLFESEQSKKILSVITYAFVEKGVQTTLQIQEALNYDMTASKFNDVADGWDYALALVKQTAESN